MKSRIKISVDGDIRLHIAYEGEGYATLCGLDGNDSDDEGDGQVTLDHPKSGKIDCDHCKRIAAEGRKWRESDFA